MKIVMLVNNNCLFDTRVIKEARSLAESGHSVSVLCLEDPLVAPVECKNGVTFIRFPKWRSIPSYLPTGNIPKATDELPRHVPRYLLKRSPFFSGALDWLRLKLKTVPMGHRRGVLPRERWGAVTPGKNHVRTLWGRLLFLQRQFMLFVLTPSGFEFLKYRKMFVEFIVKNNFDVIHAHDLTTLPAGVAAKRKSKAILIYDSHELEMHRHTPYSRQEKWLRQKVEAYCIRRADSVITVCKSIAKYLEEAYNISEPYVVYNGPDVKNFEQAPGDVRRAAELADKIPLGLYVGAVTLNRGLEYCVRALTHVPDMHLATVGPKRPHIVAALLREAEDLGVKDRLHLIDPVDPNQVTSFIRTADFALVPIQNVCLSYYFCLPNKLFESVLAGLPVGGARLVEIENFIMTTNTGLIMDETDPENISQVMTELYRRKNDFRPSPESHKAILDQYGWEKQKQTLTDIYQFVAIQRKMQKDVRFKGFWGS